MGTKDGVPKLISPNKKAIITDFELFIYAGNLILEPTGLVW